MNLELQAAGATTFDELVPCEWTASPEAPVIERGTVHLWRVQLPALASSLPWLRSLLSSDELAKAERYRLIEVRDRSILTRGALRQILSRYVEIDPEQLHFCYSATGKPSLNPASGGDWLRFNLSHKGGLMLCAVCTGREVGVDVEQLDGIQTGADIAGLFFTGEEGRFLQSVPEARRPAAFLHCWTRHEARAKALGRGLAMTWSDVRENETPADMEPCTIKSLCPARGYIAAVATVGMMAELKTWEWPVQ